MMIEMVDPDSGIVDLATTAREMRDANEHDPEVLAVIDRLESGASKEERCGFYILRSVNES